MILTYESHSPTQANQLEQWDEALLEVAAKLSSLSWQTPGWKSFMEACQRGNLDFLYAELDSVRKELSSINSECSAANLFDQEAMFERKILTEIAQTWNCAVFEALSAAHGEGCWLFAYQSAELANRLLVALKERSQQTLAA